jgi:uncharacterized damage-inducible protein DinB
MRLRFVSIAAACSIALPGAGLSAQNPVASGLQRLTARAARNLVESAEEMPADKYGYKPTPAQMTFGEVVVHLVQGNGMMCGWVSGTPQTEPSKVTPQDSKETLVSQLKQSFDYCTTALGRVDDAKLSDSVPFFGGRKVTRAMAMLILVDDWADHYSQAAIYLRLNGLVPPTAKRKES